MCRLDRLEAHSDESAHRRQEAFLNLEVVFENNIKVVNFLDVSLELNKNSELVTSCHHMWSRSL